LGTWSPTIGGNDYYLDIEAGIVEECKINLYDYLEDNSILTKELFNEHIGAIVDIALTREEHDGPLALGALILKFGAIFPKHIKEAVLAEIHREIKSYVYDDPNYRKIRHFHLRNFKNKVNDYQEGTKAALKEESLIGISFKLGFLEPCLEGMKIVKAPKKMHKFVMMLLLNLKTPFKEISHKLGLLSSQDITHFFSEIETFGEELGRSTQEREAVGFNLIFLAKLFRDHIEHNKKIESVWVDYTNLEELSSQPELGKEYGPMYQIYKLSLWGKPYIGQCNISGNRRAAQHIAKFKVAP